MQPRFLVVIPTYGQFDYAAAACESLFRTTPDAVAMVVDDASPEMLERYKRHEPGPHPLLLVDHAETNTGVLPIKIRERGAKRRAIGVNLCLLGIRIQRAGDKHFHQVALRQFSSFHGVYFRQVLRDAAPFFTFIAARP